MKEPVCFFFSEREAGHSTKNWGLHFHNLPEELANRVKGFICHHGQTCSAKHNELTRECAPFIQCDCDEYLFIEFWGPNPERMRVFADILVAEIKGLPEIFARVRTDDDMQRYVFGRK